MLLTALQWVTIGQSRIYGLTHIIRVIVIYVRTSGGRSAHVHVRTSGGRSAHVHVRT